MGNEQSKKRDSVASTTSSATDETEKGPRTWREHRRDIFSSFGYSTTAAAKSDDIPPDDIFVPIQADDILPQIPISNHHPVPRAGIEDNDLRTLHTNSFYANAFLGGQNQPVWTHPYSLWWGKGSQDLGTLQTWGMNIGHVEEADLQYGPGEPPKVGRNKVRRLRTTDHILRSSTTLASSPSSSPRPSSIRRPP